MVSPQRLMPFGNISPRILRSVEKSPLLSPKSPARDFLKKTNERKNQLSPFNIDTPNRKKILDNGLQNKHVTVLGCGRFGTVYKALYKGDQVAAKVMQTGKFTSALNSEMHATLLKHSNIVKVLMIEQGSSLSLITMELCGITLQDRLDEAALSKEKRIFILKNITCALQFCHNAGILHADIKPKNILISADDQPKLTDFGSSVAIAEPNRPFEFHGTPGYIAPEILRGKQPTPASDIYSLGIVAWQMVSRKLPFSGLHSHAIIYLSAKGKRPEDNNINDEFKGTYKALYRQMWSQNHIDRPTTERVINKIDALIAQ